MGDKGKSKKRISISPEEQLARAARAKRKFRAAVRFVMQNIYWLEDIEEEELGQDAQKNIILLTKKKEKKSSLSLQDKAILNRPNDLRSDEDRQRLQRVIGSLKCFRRFPNHVKLELSAVTYFVYHGPGRTIARQGDEARGMYFLITGEVVISQISFDPVLKKMVKADIASMGPGCTFGEVSLLHNIPRTSTVDTITHCELLYLKKEDFDVVLKQSVQQQWDEIKSAMNRFTYFEDWDDMTIRECCIIAKMKAYHADQTILGDGFGLREYVYFILKGQCRVIEHLLVQSRIVNGKKRYELFDTTLLEEAARRKSIDRIQGTLSKAGLKNMSSSRAGLTESRNLNSSTIASPKAAKSSTMAYGQQSAILNLTAKPPTRRSIVEFPPGVETYFMQICLLNETACFGIGENLNHRRIAAVTQTECLLIPRYWLLQRNKGNIWSKVSQFLNVHIPDTKYIFQQFIKRRKWKLYRQQLVKDIMANKKSRSGNCYWNIPYSIRINEDLELNEKPAHNKR